LQLLGDGYEERGIERYTAAGLEETRLNVK
jgi:hypothetical protein